VSVTTGLPALQGSNLSVRDPPRLHSEPLKLLNSEFNVCEKG
jgi:hypothetical protein